MGREEEWIWEGWGRSKNDQNELYRILKNKQTKKTFKVLKEKKTKQYGDI